MRFVIQRVRKVKLELMEKCLEYWKRIYGADWSQQFRYKRDC